MASAMCWPTDRTPPTTTSFHYGIEPHQQRELVDKVCSSVAAVVPELIQRARYTRGFELIGSRMLREWSAGLQRLKCRITVAVPDIAGLAETAGFQHAPAPAAHVSERLGQSPLLSERRRGRKPIPAS